MREPHRCTDACAVVRKRPRPLETEDVVAALRAWADKIESTDPRTLSIYFHEADEHLGEVGAAEHIAVRICPEDPDAPIVYPVVNALRSA